MRRNLWIGSLLSATILCGCGTPSQVVTDPSLVLPEQIIEAGVNFDFAPGFDRGKGEMEPVVVDQKIAANPQSFRLYLKGKPRRYFGVIHVGDYVRFTADDHVSVNGSERMSAPYSASTPQ